MSEPYHSQNQSFPLDENSDPPSCPNHPSPQSPEPPVFIPPPLPLFAEGRHLFFHPIEGIPSIGVLSNPLSVIPLDPDGPYLSFFTLHLCEHAGLAHTQAFIGSINLRTGKGYSNPTDQLSWTLTISLIFITARPPSQSENIDHALHP